MGSVYTHLKIFNFNEKINSLPHEVGEIKPPIHIRIKPTNACAHDCWYCVYKADGLQLGQDMEKRDYIPKEKMMEIIEDIEEMGVKAVTFSGGGDPFYYKHLLETVKKLAQASIKFASYTNGARLDGALAEVFAHEATWLRISIDGWDDESYAEYRGIRKGEFTKLMNNIENFMKYGGKCDLSVVIIIDHKNAFHLYDSLKRLKNIGVKSVKIAPCIVSNQGDENKKYHQTIFQEVTEQIQKGMEHLASTEFELFDAYHELGSKFEKNYTWCPYLQILPVIGADLNIYSCQDKAYNLEEGLLGSIKHQRFSEFWHSDKNNFFKIDPSQHCNHHCVSNIKNQMILDYLNVDQEHFEFV